MTLGLELLLLALLLILFPVQTLILLDLFIAYAQRERPTLEDQHKTDTPPNP